MGRKRKPSVAKAGAAPEYHATIPGELALALDDYAEDKSASRMDFVRQAVREKLEAVGYWPRRKPEPS